MQGTTQCLRGIPVIPATLTAPAFEEPASSTHKTRNRHSGTIRNSVFLCLLMGCMLAALFATQPSFAASLPGGTYSQTCRDARLQGDTLTATCQTSHLLGSSWKGTSLDAVSSCNGDIFNVEGSLHCNRNIPLPDGSYRKTCRDIYVQANVAGDPSPWLFASCKLSSANEWLPFFLPDYQSCKGEIFNYEGFLACNKGTLPPGSYVKSCSDLVMSGSMVAGHCRDAGGNPHTAVLKDPNTCRGPIENRNGTLTCPR
jgi:hypothetical protein